MEAFRAQVRALLHAQLPDDLRAKVLSHQRLDREDYLRWQRILAAQGWLGASWPVEHGGTGWNAAQVLAFDDECWQAGAPEVLAFGMKMLAPVLMRYGTPAQQAFYLPRMLQSQDWWCQGYSEPGSGSDLASLRTAGTVDGDWLLINGQKTWTTYAHHANRMFCLVRTGGADRPQDAISFVLVDLALPGITIRPIALMDGSHDVNEVFFDNVRVPLAEVVGGLGAGWRCAKALLSHERLSVGKAGRSRRELELLKRIAPPTFAGQIAALELDLFALECLTQRLVAEMEQGQDVAAKASMLKIRGTEIAQSVSALLVEASDPPRPELIAQYFNWRKLSIYGGSNEIQRNIIARHVLGF